MQALEPSDARQRSVCLAWAEMFLRRVHVAGHVASSRLVNRVCARQHELELSAHEGLAVDLNVGVFWEDWHDVLAEVCITGMGVWVVRASAVDSVESLPSGWAEQVCRRSLGRRLSVEPGR